MCSFKAGLPDYSPKRPPRRKANFTTASLETKARVLSWKRRHRALARAGHSALLQQHPAPREPQEQGQKELLKPCWLQTVRFPLLFQRLDGEG